MKARLPEGMGKGPGNMNSMLKQMQKLQEDMENMQAGLEEQEFEISSGGGVCKIVISGSKEIRSITLDPEIVDPDDIETLQDIIVAGVNEAIKQVDAESQSQMSKLTGGLNLPNIPGIF